MTALALLLAACGEVGADHGLADQAPTTTVYVTTTTTRYVSQVTTSLPPEAVPPPSPEFPLEVRPVEQPPVPVTDQAFSAALVGILDAGDQAPCPVLVLDGARFVVYPQERSPLAAVGLAEFDDQEVVVAGGPPAPSADLDLGCDGPVWVATSIVPLGSVDLERSRLHPEPRWDPHYSGLVVEFESVRITYDRWFWAILDDAGFITVEIDGEQVLHGPSEWIHAPDLRAPVTRFIDPWTGQVVVTMPNTLFDAAYTEAALASGAWEQPADR